MSAQPDQPLGHDLELRVGRVEWPRTFGQVHREWAQVQARMRRISSVPGRRMDDLSPSENTEMGLWAAAAWTLGEVGAAPMIRAGKELTWDQVERELSLAQTIAQLRNGWEYATGVLSWLSWISGDAPAVRYPA